MIKFLLDLHLRIYKGFKKRVQLLFNIQEYIKMKDIGRNKPLYKSKSFWTGLAGIVASVGGYLTGEMDLQVALPAAITALSVIFLRAGMRD